MKQTNQQNNQHKDSNVGTSLPKVKIVPEPKPKK